MSLEAINTENPEYFVREMKAPLSFEFCDTLSDAVNQLLSCQNPHKLLQNNTEDLKRLRHLITTVTSNFEGPDNEYFAYELHKSLNTIYDYQLNASNQASQFDPIVMEIMLELEDAWISFERT